MKCDIDGVVIRELTRYSDERGWLFELFRRDEIDQDIFPADIDESAVPSLFLAMRTAIGKPAIIFNKVAIAPIK